MRTMVWSMELPPKSLEMHAVYPCLILNNPLPDYVGVQAPYLRGCLHVPITVQLSKNWLKEIPYNKL